MPPAVFAESLNVSVTLTANGRSASVDGGNVKELSLDLLLHGFSGRVRTWVVAADGEDLLYPLILGSEMLAIELRIAKSLYEIAPEPDPLVLSALVTVRRLREIPSPNLSGNPVLYREYELDFLDAPQALWTEHRPCAVYARTSLEKVIKENTPSAVSTKLEWSALKRVRGILCLGLGVETASFYDFLFWLADRESGHICYDYGAQQLLVGSAKPISTAETFVPGAIENPLCIQVSLAPRSRHAVNVLNSRAGATNKLEVEQPDAADGVRRDYLVHTPLNAEAKARQATERERVLPGRFDVEVDCAGYPEMYLAPGVCTKLASDCGDKLLISGESLRVIALRLRANATNQTPEFDVESDSTEYQTSFTLELEPINDPRWRGPMYREPRYPFEVEARVLSSIGNEGDRSYTVYDDNDYYGAYKVRFELWNSTVTIPVRPDFVPGHLYFPVPKDSRVFMSLDFESARISRFLEWSKDVTVPNTSQGNHLLLGRNEKSETSIKHWYVDSAPQLIIGRVNASDMGTITLEEGTLTLELTEDGGGAGFATTVSVEPEAQMAKAKAAQDSELAIADLQDGAQTASEELGDAAEKAASSLLGQAEQARSNVETNANELEDALRGVSGDIDEQIDRLQESADETRKRIDELLR